MQHPVTQHTQCSAQMDYENKCPAKYSHQIMKDMRMQQKQTMKAAYIFQNNMYYKHLHPLGMLVL
jgi:16S rRNA C1402 N4-methylase RsmH